MNKLIRFLKNISFLLYLVFLFISFYFFINEQSKLSIDALLWAIAYMVVEYGFSNMLKSRLLDKRQSNYKIVFLYESQAISESTIDKVKEMKEIQDFLEMPSVTSCNFMVAEDYKTINPTVSLHSFPSYLVLNGENLINDKILLKNPLFHSTSIKEVMEFITKHQRKSK